MDRKSEQGGERMSKKDVSMDSVSAAKLILERVNEERHQEDMELYHAIQEARKEGKEDFDVDAFAEYYHGDQLIGDRIDEKTSDASLEAFMRDYYLGHPDIKTMKDYAILLNKNSE